MLGSVHMGWRHLLFANWPVDPQIVSPHLPAGLTLDTYDGDAWLSIVPFTNVDLRPTWVPNDMGLTLPELNLRTYVRCGDASGVYFFSLDADGILGVLGARIFHHLPYYRASIDLDIHGDRTRFECQRKHPGARSAHFYATYRPHSRPLPAPTGSLEFFLTERYRYFTDDQQGRLRFAEISHEPWELQGVGVEIEENTLFRANQFDHPERDVVNFYSKGVDTIASSSRLVTNG